MIEVREFRSLKYGSFQAVSAADAVHIMQRGGEWRRISPTEWVYTVPAILSLVYFHNMTRRFSASLARVVNDLAKGFDETAVAINNFMKKWKEDKQ